MVSIDVNKSTILIKDGMIDFCGEFIADKLPACKILIISDVNVAGIYTSKIKMQLEKYGFPSCLFTINSGENSKSIETMTEIYKILAQENFSRSDATVAVGGGVTTDIAGFVAATYNRGINLIHIPTSFLAQIDASIGGKNGVNLLYGKNLVGTFYQPRLILIDSKTLKTLPENELNNGIAEAIKCGCIMDRQLFEILEDQAFWETSNEIIHRSILVKKQLVEQDEFDCRERMLLNFGHTIGHAIEKLSDFKISHGEAVALGMNIITKISEHMGLTKSGTADRISRICEKYNLSTETDFSIEEISKAISHDKKISGGKLNLILLKNIGESFIYPIDSDKILHFLKGGIRV